MESEIVELISRVKQNDESAFSELCDKYRTMTEAAVHRFMPSFKDGGEYGIDDLRQYAAVALYRAAETYDPDAEKKGKAVSFGLYAKICVNNALISVFRKYRSVRKKSVRKSSENENEINRSGKLRLSDPLEKLISAESADDLRKKIGSVLSKYETEIFYEYLSGKTVSEMACRFGKDEKSVSNALYRVKTKIKCLLKNK